MDESRNKFEAWYRENAIGGVWSINCERQWRAWQASRAQAVADATTQTDEDQWISDGGDHPTHEELAERIRQRVAEIAAVHKQRSQIESGRYDGACGGQAVIETWRDGVLIERRFGSSVREAEVSPGDEAARISFLLKHWDTQFNGRRIADWIADARVVFEHGSVIETVDFYRAALEIEQSKNGVAP